MGPGTPPLGEGGHSGRVTRASPPGELMFAGGLEGDPGPRL